MAPITRLFNKREEIDPEKIGLCSSIIFIDAGARCGELYKNNDSGEFIGTFFELSTDEKSLNVRTDLGAHAPNAFKPWPFKINRKNFTNCEFHLFEPNPEFFEKLCQVAKHISSATGPIYVHRMAVSNKYLNGIDFHLTEGGWGSTLKEDKLHEHFTDSIPVKVIDFVDFVAQLQTRGSTEEIHIKLDIEGSEYDVLPSLFPRFPKSLKSLSVEFHRDQFPEQDKKFWKDCNFACFNIISMGCHFNWWPGEW